MDNRALIDWISFSLPMAFEAKVDRYGNYTTNDEYVQQILDDISNSTGIDLPFVNLSIKGGKFYKQQISMYADNGRRLCSIAIDPTTKFNRDTTSVTIPGYALSADNHDHPFDPFTIIKQVRDYDGHLTRLDLALDNFDRPDLMQNVVNNSRPDVWSDRIISPLRFEVPININGTSVTYGQKGFGKNSICIYDKARKQEIDGTWTRAEFRSQNRELLAQIADDLISGKPLQELTSQLLAKYLSFRSPGLKTKYKRPVSAWWDEFLQLATAYVVSRHTGAKTDDEDRKVTYSQIDRLKVQIRTLAKSNPDAARAMLIEAAAELGLNLQPDNGP